jgi:copper transport protein
VRRRARLAVAAAAAVMALAVPSVAAAHAYLVKTAPTASGVLAAPPAAVQLTFDEAVEPRFAIVSVTDVDATSQATGPVTRSPADPDTLVVPVKHLPEGWYLVYWRAISVDGHPVQGAFTFAVGPNPGPAPQFVIPHVAATATSSRLVVAKWAAFLTMMSAIGLFVLRILVARPLVRRVEGASLRPVSVAFMVAAGLALVAIPVYLEESASIDSLRSFFAVGSLVPLWRATANGRGYVDLELCFGLFTAAALAAIWADRPERPVRSVAALVATSGALIGAGATLLLPGTVGHAGQTSPRGLTVALDWVHLVSGSVWVGGLIGVLVLWSALGSARLAGLRVVVPRFSNVALFSVLLLLGTGIGEAIVHLPVLAALWQTTYGKVILVKAAILLVAMLLAAFNLLRTKPGLAGGHGEGSARLLRGLVAGETLLVAGAILAASVLSSLAPPPPSFAEAGRAQAKVGPGKVAETVQRDGYTIEALVAPNRAAAPNDFALRVTRNGAPVTGADVTLTFAMLDMLMTNQEYALEETSPGVYSRTSPALVMVGHWGLTYSVTPPGREPFTVTIVDHASG